MKAITKLDAGPAPKSQKRVERMLGNSFAEKYRYRMTFRESCKGPAASRLRKVLLDSMFGQEFLTLRFIINKARWAMGWTPSQAQSALTSLIKAGDVHKSTVPKQ